MKKIWFAIPALAIMASCGSGEKTDETTEDSTVVETVVYTVSPESTLSWEGYKQDEVDKGHSRMGTFNVSEGSLTMNGEELSAANFTVDFNSIAISEEDTTLNEEWRGKLVGHLLSADFLIADSSITTATYELVSYADGNATGNLTFLGMTKEVTFPIAVTNEEGNVVATGDFTVDLSEFGVPGFQKESEDAVEFISPEVKFSANITATK